MPLISKKRFTFLAKNGDTKNSDNLFIRKVTTEYAFENVFEKVPFMQNLFIHLIQTTYIE